MPIRVIVTQGTVADCTQAAQLIEGLSAEHLLADKGYDSDAIVEQATAQGMSVVIPPRKNRKEQRRLAAGTRRGLVYIVGRLLRQKYAGRVVDISKLRPDDVRRFTAHQLEVHPTVSHASKLAAALRSYLRYRTTCGNEVGALTAAISSPVHWKRASLPRALKPEEVERLLNSFTSDLRWPKRGYVIVRCALDMGLRSCEVDLAAHEVRDARLRDAEQIGRLRLAHADAGDMILFKAIIKTERSFMFFASSGVSSMASHTLENRLLLFAPSPSTNSDSISLR